MKNIGIRRALSRGGALLLTFCILLSSFLWIIPIGASATENYESEHSRNHIDEWDEYYREKSVTPKNVEGKLFLGTDALKSPVKKAYGDGSYYDPQTYIYFGRYKNPQTDQEEPVLLRVLDAEKDSEGNEGAFFVLTENAILTENVFSTVGSSFQGNVNYSYKDNIYSNSVIGEAGYLDGLMEKRLNSAYKNFFSNIPEPFDYVRAVSKTDVKSDMQGLFGFDVEKSSLLWETDTIDENGNVVDSDSAEYVKNAKFFPLSARELADYVADTPNAPGLVATHLYSRLPVDYWLRTGLDSKELENETGNYVGAVSSDGSVTQADANERLNLRLGFNIETEDIAYMHEMSDKTYRMAFIEPLYKNTDTPFDAWVVDEYKGGDEYKGLITVEYTNAIRDKASTSYSDVDQESYVSVMIRDKETDEVLYYDTISSVPTDYNCDPSFISNKNSTAKFNLPSNFSRDEHDVYVFWERKSELSGDVSYVSNMAKLDCVHEEGKAAGCNAPAICKHCNESYGEINPYNHPDTDTSVFFCNHTINVHWNVCPHCDEKIDVEECVFNKGTCKDRCECGNILFSNNEHGEQHYFDDDGICSRAYERHFQIPQMEETNNFIDVKIENIGNFIALAKMVNRGELDGYRIYVYINKNLNFDTGSLDLFVPLGTEEHPFKGSIIGQGKTISNITYRSDEKYVGLIGYAEELSIRDLTLRKCEFEGADRVGIIAGGFKNGDVTSSVSFTDLKIYDCKATATADDGVEAILTAKMGCRGSVNDVFARNVTDNANNNLRFLSNPDEYEVTFSNSACLYENGSKEYGEYPEAAFVSGEVAYDLNMGQKLGTDSYPTSDSYTSSSPRVFAIRHCDGKLIGYTNDVISIHYQEDWVEHRLTEFYGFIWDGMYADAEVYCDACKQKVTVPVEVECGYTLDKSNRVVAVECKASITLDDGSVHEGENSITSIKIEDMIGITPRTVEYDGSPIDPESFMDNHRLCVSPPGYKEYDVFFIDAATGEVMFETYPNFPYEDRIVALSATDVGAYHLKVIGRNAYEGQEFIYENVLTITPTVIDVEVYDVFKYYDGNAKFEVDYSCDREDEIYFDYEILLSDAASSDVGEYELNVSVKQSESEGKSNAEFRLSRTKITGYILPAKTASVENKSYPTIITYGESLPDPTPAHFNLSAQAELNFQWFEVKEDRNSNYTKIYKALTEKPVNAGNYVLRVAVENTDKLIASVFEVEIEILKKPLSLIFKDPDGNIIDHNGDSEDEKPIFTLEMGEELIPIVGGFVYGDTAESVGIELEIYHWSREKSWNNSYTPTFDFQYIFPYQYFDGGYIVTYRAKVGDNNAVYENYEYVDERVYVDIALPSPDMPPVPIVGAVGFDTWIVEGDESHSFGLFITWNDPDESVNNSYTVKVNGEVAVKNLTDDKDFNMSNKPYYVYHVDEILNGGEYRIEILSNEEVIRTINAQLSVTDSAGNAVTEIIAMGDYLISVTLDPDDDEKKQTVTEIMTVKREIPMDIKELDYFISEGKVEFDPTMAVMRADKTFSVEHNLVDVDIYVDVEYGKIDVRSFKVVMKNDPSIDVSHLYLPDSSNNPHGEGNNCTAHIFDSRCDTKCNIGGCDRRREGAHTGGEASCCELAVCEHCSVEYGEYDLTNHNCEDTHTVPNPDDLNTHNVIYLCCGGIKETAAHVEQTAATCIEKAICAVCGWHYGELDPHNHVSDEYRYSPDAENPNLHIKTRACCGESHAEAHTGGVATCCALAECEHCKAPYGELDPNNHSGEMSYALSDDGKTHIASCKGCNTSFNEEHTGGSANCCEQAICDKCKEHYGELDADNHTSEEISYSVRAENPSMHDVKHSCCGAIISKEFHSGGEANCCSGKICEYCGDEYGLKNANNHASDKFRYEQSSDDPNMHIKYHECCNELILTEPHSGESNASCEHGDICEVCGLEYSDPLPHEYDNECDYICNICNNESRPKTVHSDEDGNGYCDHCDAKIEGGGLSGGAISGIATASVVAGGGIGFSIFWFAIKKKSWAELLKLLIG